MLTDSELPLAGIKVIDMSQVFMGPGAAVYLGDQGAEVIKVEPLSGDSFRWRYATPKLKQHGFGKAFLALNRNKRSIAVESRTIEGQEIVHRLAKWADVFILNFRPGAEVKARLDYETLAAINPRLIYAGVSAFGREGPEASLPGYDMVIQARAGMLALLRNTDGTPRPTMIMISDMSGCMGLAYAVMVALWEREKTGRGQRIDMSLLQTGLAMQMQQLVWVEEDESDLPGLQSSSLTGCYRCSDDRWVVVVAVEDGQFKAICRVLDLEHLAEDPRLATADRRAQLAEEVNEIWEAVFMTGPSTRWVEQLKAAGAPCSLVVDREALTADPQAVANGMFVTMDHPVIGKVRMVASPFHLSNTRHEARLRRPTPKLGEHTLEILRELGYAAVTVEDLCRQGIVK